MIIYFSGTGNSYAVANALSQKYNDEVVPMKRAYNDHSEHLIFVFPTYCFDVPKCVRKFLKKFPIEKGQKIMAVSISAGDNCNSQYTFIRLMKRKGFEVEKFLKVVMTDNSMPVLMGSGLYTTYVDLSKIAESFWNQTHIPKSGYNLIAKSMDIMFNTKLARSYFKTKLIPDKCIGCGLCQSICPMNNIEIIDGKAKLKGYCGQCFGCIHVCPKQALYIRKEMVERNQYINPAVSIGKLNQK